MSTVHSDPHPIHHDGPVLTAVGHAAAVVGGGLVLLNIAFGAYAAWFLLVRTALGAFVPGGPGGAGGEALGLTGNLIALAGWLLAVRWATAWAMRTHPASLGTAVWLVIPTASVLLPIGIALVDYPVAVTLAICAAGVLGVLWLMRRAGLPWEQLLAVAWVAVALGVMVVAGIDI